MSRHYDVIVAGLGAMGSATAAYLSLRGKRVAGFDTWSPGHQFGSSHGDSRIIREMYFEHPMYVPLLQRAYDLWAVLGERVDAQLLHITGGLMIGPPGGALVTGTLRSAREHDLRHELLSPAEVARRYPAFSLREDLVAVRDPRAGWLDPEACNAAHLQVAAENGAQLRFDESVESWEADDAGVEVTTRHGTFSSDYLVLAGGAYMNRLLRDLELPLEIERQAVFWFSAGGRHFDQTAFPIYAYEYAEREICYGFPRLPRGVKASIMHSGEILDDAASANRSVADEEVEPLRSALEPVLPELAAASVCERSVCLFTNTPDRDFVIDFHPRHRNVIVSSACSGHGFKFASVIGEIQADLVTEGHSRFDLEPFRISRLV